MRAGVLLLVPLLASLARIGAEPVWKESMAAAVAEPLRELARMIAGGARGTNHTVESGRRMDGERAKIPTTEKSTTMEKPTRSRVLGTVRSGVEQTKVVKDYKKDRAKIKVPSQPAKPSQTDKPTLVASKKAARGDNATRPFTEAEESRNGSASRQHKASFLSYPGMERGYQDKATKSSSPSGTYSASRKKPTKPKQKPPKQKPDSDIYYIKLPPTPYSYVPGLGYISRPPSFSTASLQRPNHHHHHHHKTSTNPFIKLPLEFVSNGKPTGVYKWTPPGKGNARPNKNKLQDSPIVRLNRGPYVFDGRPTGVYLMKRTRPKSKY